MEENRHFDCFRGCVTERKPDGILECTYRAGCCKMEVYDYLMGIRQPLCNNLFEVRFKNTRKGIYRNASGQTIKIGDLVVVEAANGHDLGIVTLEGPVVEHQMRCKKISQDNTEFRKIYRRAKTLDIEKWQEAIAREHKTMIRARELAANLSLEMKIGDVEFQGDGTKAIFYYIADGRVDFRQLIKDFAEEFQIRVEMKQIGARQEAGLIGGLGVCGRELCCSNYLTDFKSISTSAARCQDLSLNPQKLQGQCGKLKCCLNYEVAAYMDAQSHLPRLHQPLEFMDGQAWLAKTDILAQKMYFTYEKGSLANLYCLTANEVKEVLELNRKGIKPDTIKEESVPDEPEFRTSVGDDSISRFDSKGSSRKKHHHGGRGRRDGRRDGRGDRRGGNGGDSRGKGGASDGGGADNA